MRFAITGRTARRGIAAIAVVLLLSAPAALYPQSSADETMMFNVQTHKVHKPTCTWAIKCTKNCIPLKRSEAYKRGEIPCKVCGG